MVLAECERLECVSATSVFCEGLASVEWSVGFEQRWMCAYGSHTSERKILLPMYQIYNQCRLLNTNSNYGN